MLIQTVIVPQWTVIVLPWPDLSGLWIILLCLVVLFIEMK